MDNPDRQPHAAGEKSQHKMNSVREPPDVFVVDDDLLISATTIMPSVSLSILCNTAGLFGGA
jgi:hypothetical protein